MLDLRSVKEVIDEGVTAVLDIAIGAITLDFSGLTLTDDEEI